MENTKDVNKAAGAPSALNAGLGASGQMYLHHDDVSDRLDEIADLCEHWKRWRDGRAYTPQAVRSALVMLAREVVMLAEMEQKNGPRMEPIGHP